MKQKSIAIILVFSLLFILLMGCSKEPQTQYTRYTNSFFDTFNTLVQVVAYTKTEEEFNQYFEKTNARYQELHKLFDIYNTYEGINNVKTINDNAGIEPVKVEQEIIDLIVFAKDWYAKTGQANIALGAVLKIWHEYRTEGIYNPEEAEVPPRELLEKAAEHTDLDKVIVDEINNTVFLADPEMSLDVGAIAKGYATELVVQELIADSLISGIISAGGNIRTIGKPLNGLRERWNIGIQNPDDSIVSDSGMLDVVYVEDASVVSSGDYQRYYTVNGKIYHHLIDPDTLMPGEYFRAVSIVAEDSGVADFLSTALFLMPYEEALELTDSIEGVEALWVMQDGTVRATEGMKKIMKSEGATNSSNN